MKWSLARAIFKSQLTGFFFVLKKANASGGARIKLIVKQDHVDVVHVIMKEVQGIRC